MGDSNQDLDVLLHQYDHALHIAQFADTASWEVTSIIWGANTLMLGFVLEADPAKVKVLIQTTAILGVILSGIVLAVFHATKIGKDRAYFVCQEIEERLSRLGTVYNSGSVFHYLHKHNAEAYPKHFMRSLVWTVSIVFLIAWAVVGHSAMGWWGASLVLLAAGGLGGLTVFFWKRGLKEIGTETHS